MHEWALAEGVIKTAIEKAREHGIKKINEIDLKIGEMQDIEMDIFKFALDELMKEYGMEAKVNIKIQKTRLRCNVCNHEWSFDEFKLSDEEKEFVHFLPESIFSYARCPKCGSQYFEIVEGRGVWIEAIRGNDD